MTVREADTGLTARSDSGLPVPFDPEKEVPFPGGADLSVCQGRAVPERQMASINSRMNGRPAPTAEASIL